MYKYNIVYRCSNGYEGVETVMAANRTMAFMVFERLGIEGVVSTDCFRVMEEEEN